MIYFNEVIWVFPKIGVFPPKWMLQNKNPIKMDDLGVSLFLETSILWDVSFFFTGPTRGWKTDPFFQDSCFPNMPSFDPAAM